MSTEYQPRTAERLIEILNAQDDNPRSWQREAAVTIAQLEAALKECANRLERACRVVGNDDETAAAAVAKYRTLCADGNTK